MSADAVSGVLHPNIVAEGELFDTGIKQTLSRLTKFERWMILIGVALAAALELGTQIAINIILTDMKGNVAASQDELSWIVTAYGAAFLSVVPLTTWFVRRLGHRNYLVLSLLLYGAGAFGCFLSETLPELLMARIIMGIGGGAFLVRALTAVNRLYAHQERGQAFAVLGGIVNLSRAFMPVLFGFVTDNGRWNFCVSGPCSVDAACRQLALHLHTSPPRVRARASSHRLRRNKPHRGRTDRVSDRDDPR